MALVHPDVSEVSKFSEDTWFVDEEGLSMQEAVTTPAVGVSLGRLDGFSLGFELGGELGILDGDNDGFVVGAEEGFFDGCGDGRALGIRVGRVLGLLVG